MEGEEMLKECSNAGDKHRHYRGLSNDVVPGGQCCEVPKENGDEIYCMDNQTVWLADEENKQWINQSDGSVVAWT